MSKCRYCGGEIEFRYIDGQIKPLHFGGSCSGEIYPSEYEIKERAWNSPHDEFCRPTICPRCDLDVYFIRHNGGSVWVDDLGWPWPKHACFDEPRAARSPQSLADAASSSTFKPNLGLVVKARSLSLKFTALLVRLANKRYVRMLIEGGTPELTGELITISHDLQVLRTCLENHIVLKILKWDSAEASTTIGDYWNTSNRYASRATTIQQPCCPYCHREIFHKKLIDHLCTVHGHDDVTESSLLVHCKLCSRGITERDLLGHVIKEHVISGNVV